MLKIITGGSGSGKSEYAENLAVRTAEGPLIYIATMFPFDEECHRRIARHREMRKEKHFSTIECYTGLSKIQVDRNSTVLLECMSNLVANEMYQEDGAGEQTVEAVLKGVESLEAQCHQLVIVTNEIFSDGMDYDAETVRYQQYLGAINTALAGRACQVTEVVYGIPVHHRKKEKG